MRGQAARASWQGNLNEDPPWSPRFVCRHTFPRFAHTAVASCGAAGGGSAEPAAAVWARRRTEATATDTRRTRTDISTRCSVMRSACRPLARGGEWVALRAGMDEERLRGGRHGMSAISACVFPESSLFYFSPGALHLPHAHQRGREGGIHCGTHLTRLRIDKAQGAQAAQPVRSRLGARPLILQAYCNNGGRRAHPRW